MLKVIEQSHKQAIKGIKDLFIKLKNNIAGIIANNAAIKK
jgi:hypothetical protein